MWKLRQHLVTHKSKTKNNNPPPSGIPIDHLYVDQSKSNAVVTEDHQYSQIDNADSEDDVTSTPMPMNNKRIDHLYSAKKLSKKEAAELAAKKEKNYQMKKLDHLYSAPSSPSSPTSVGKVVRKSKKVVAKKVKRQSVKALGHSYAAARPRRLSGKCLTLEKNIANIFTICVTL